MNSHQLATLLFVEFVFDYNQVNEVSHLCSTDGWKEYQQYRNEATMKQNKDFKLITVIPYIDEYVHHNARQTSYLGIYVMLGNIPISVRNADILDICLLLTYGLRK